MSITPSGPLMGDDGGRSAGAVTPAQIEERWRNKDPRTDRCIVVTGMHHSGASAIAGALCEAGAWAGPDADLIPVALNKPRGRYERREASEALEAELAKRGGSWSNPPLDQLQPWTQEQLRPTLRRVLSTATTDTPKGTIPLIKDSRLCLFAAELKTLLLDSWPVVVAVRHPLEVARALFDQDGLSMQAGLALWEIYNQSVCAGLAGRPVHVVRYESLLEEPGDVAGRLVEQVLAPGEPVPPSAHDRAAAHLARELRNHRADVADEDRWLSVAALRLWHQLEAASQSPVATPLPAVELSYGAAQHVKLEAIRQRLEAQVHEQTTGAAERDRYLADREALESEVAQLRAANLADREALESEVAQLRAANLADREALESEVAQLRATNVADRAALEAELTELRVRNQSLADALSAAEATLAAAQEELSGYRTVAAANEELVRRVDELTVANEGFLQQFQNLRELRVKALESLTESERERDRIVAANELLDQRYQSDVRRLLVEVDAARGEIESVRSAYFEACEGANALREAADALSAALQDTSDELARVDHHRQRLIEDINAIGSSQSWRLGYAMTWPVRVFRRSPRREGGQADSGS